MWSQSYPLSMTFSCQHDITRYWYILMHQGELWASQWWEWYLPDQTRALAALSRFWFDPPLWLTTGWGRPAYSSTALTPIVIQILIDCHEICASTPWPHISTQAYSPPTWICVLFVYPGFRWGLWELGLKMPQGDDWVCSMGPPPLGVVIVRTPTITHLP